MIRQIFRILSAICLISSLASCSGRGRVDPFDTVGTSPAPWDLIDQDEEGASQEPREAASDKSGTIGMAGTSAEADSAADIPALRSGMSRYNRIGRLREVFNDSNKYQYAAAERIGISPIRSLADAYFLKRPLVKIESCQWYDVDTLKHSMPYLVPEAATLLETIGRNFKDSVEKQGGTGIKFRVTSLLRTSHSVKRLRRVNRNATDSSTHQFATTFDISYAHFNDDGQPRTLSDEQLKYILGEVLYDLRRQNRCMVKFERKSPCYHITATGL